MSNKMLRNSPKMFAQSTFFWLLEFVLQFIFIAHLPYDLSSVIQTHKQIWLSCFTAFVQQLLLVWLVKTCKAEQREKSVEAKTCKGSCLCFCLLASYILRESEEHVTGWDQDPPWAPRTLLQPITGRHTFLSTVIVLFKHITFTAKLFM